MTASTQAPIRSKSRQWDDSPFTDPQWTDTWLRAFSPHRQLLHVPLDWQRPERADLYFDVIDGVATLCPSRLTDLVRLPVGRPSKDGRSIATAVRKVLAGNDIARVRFRQVEPDGDTRLLADLLAESAHRITVHEHRYHRLDLQEPSSHEWNNTTRKKERRLARMGLRHGVTASDDPDFDELLLKAAGIHRYRWNAAGFPSIFDEPGVLTFVQDVTTHVVGAVLHTVRSTEGDVVAFRIGFLRNGRYFDWLTAYDPDFRHLSPGTVLLSHAISHAMRTGCESFEFLSGEEPYKLRHTTGSTAVTTILLDLSEDRHARA